MVGLLVHIEGDVVLLGEVPEAGVGEVECHVEERDNPLVDLDGDPEAVGFEYVGDLLLDGLVLLGILGADLQAIVTVEAEGDRQVLQLGEQEQSHQIAGLGTVPASHADVKAVVPLLHPDCAPVEQEGVLGLMEELPVRLADGDQVGGPVESPDEQLWGDAGAIGVDVKLEERILQISIARCQIEAEIHSFPTMYGKG